MMVSPESYGALNEKLVEAAGQLDIVHEERALLAEELDKARQRARQLQQDKRELKESVDHWKEEVRVREENLDRLQGQNIDEYEEELNALREELRQMHQDFQDQQHQAAEAEKLQDELEALRGVYAEANETIRSLRIQQKELKKDQAENLHRLEEELTAGRELTIKLDQTASTCDALRQQQSALKGARDQLKVKIEQVNAELENANTKLIQHEITRKEQQDTITKLFKEVEEYKNELDDIQNSSRSSETSLARSHNEKLKEIGALRETNAVVTAERDARIEEVGALRARCAELEKQLDENLKTNVLSDRGEELISRLQQELDQQEQLDEKIMSHFDIDLGHRNGNSGKLQAMLDRVYDEGVNVLNLSELMLHKEKSDGERQFELETLIRRFESKIEQEKLINQDLQESLKRERQRIHEQERRQDGDRRSIESLQNQLDQSSRELGDKCLEVSRCLAEMSVIKQELIDKTNLLHASQEMIDKMRLDAEKMRHEFSQFDEQIANTKFQTEELELELTEKKDEQAKTLADLTRVRSDNEQLKRELQEAGRRLAELTDLTSSSSQLESQLREAKHAEEAERILNQKLNKELHFSKDTVAKLRNELSDKEEQLRTTSESQSGETDKLSSRLSELTRKLEQQQAIVNEARGDRDRQAEMRIEVESKLQAGVHREKRLVEKVHYLEERMLNRSSEESSDADERTSLQTARHGLEITRQQLSALSARLQVAMVRGDTQEIEQCRAELTNQHKELALVARTLNSQRSSKRAHETGILEARINEQLRKLEESTNRIHEMQGQNYNEQVVQLTEVNLALTSQLETIRIEKKTNSNMLEEYRTKVVRLESELERKENIDSSSSSSNAALVRKQQKTYERYARAESSRKALVYQKKYLLLIIGGFQETEDGTLKLISKMGALPDTNTITPRKQPLMRFRAAVRVCIAINRLEFLRRKWQKTVTRSRSSSKEVISSSLANGHKSNRLLMEHGKY